MSEDFNVLVGIQLKPGELENLKNQINNVQTNPIRLTINTQNVENQINNIRNQIENLSNITINLNGGNGNGGGIRRTVNEVNDAYRDLMRLQSRINSIRIQIGGLDSAKNSVRITDLRSQLGGLMTEYNNLYQAFNRQFSVNQLNNLNRSIEITSGKVSALSSKWSDARANLFTDIQFKIEDGVLGNQISAIEARFKSLGVTNDEVTNGIQTLKTLLASMEGNSNIVSVNTNYESFEHTLTSVTNQVNELQRAQKQVKDDAVSIRSSTLSNNISTWMNQNTKAAEKFGDELRDIQDQLQNNKNPALLSNLSSQFSNIKSKAKELGLVTNSLATSLKNTTLQVLGLSSNVMVLKKIFQVIKEGCQTIVELDTALVDLQKTTDATASQLKEFYFSANDTAKQLGVTTKEVIQAAAEWSRLGYSIKDAQTMAEASSIFEAISPDLNIEQATDGLVSAMKAFDIEANDALDGIASKVNAIGNSQAVTNGDIVDILTRASSAMKEANNSLEDTIALGTAAAEITRDASTVGTALRTKICAYVQKCA